MVYIYLKSEKQNTSSAPQKKEFVIKFFTIGRYKWKTTVYDNGYFKVSKYPYCVTHDLKFIFERFRKHCPGTEIERCTNELKEDNEFEVYESAKSIIDNKVRNKEY